MTWLLCNGTDWWNRRGETYILSLFLRMFLFFLQAGRSYQLFSFVKKVYWPTFVFFSRWIIDHVTHSSPPPLLFSLHHPSVAIPLHEPGRMLREKILLGLNLLSSSSSSSASDIPSNSCLPPAAVDSSVVRLISRGKVIKDDEDIQRQGLRNGSVVMVLLGAPLEVGKILARPAALVDYTFL